MELGPSGQERPQNDIDLKKIEISEWWNVAPDENVFGTEGSSGIARSGGGFG